MAESPLVVDDEPTRVLRALRGHFAGLLQIGDRLDPVRFALDPASGWPVLTAHADALEVDAVILHAPDDSADGVQLLGRATGIDGSLHAAADRYKAYHGMPTGRGASASWMMIEPESIRLAAVVVEAVEVIRPNELGRGEHALCKRLNADADRLADLVERRTGTRPTTPVCVGVDAWGLDVRARFGVIRVEFPSAAATPDRADAILREWGHA